MALPIWTFFAPYPGSHDAELLFRTIDHDDVASEWRHIEIYQRRRLSHVLLHPNRRLEKTVFDAVGETNLLLATRDDHDWITASPSYRTLLNVLLSRAHLPATATNVQFMLIQSGGYDDTPNSLTPAFVSDRHPLPTPPTPKAQFRRQNRGFSAETGLSAERGRGRES